MAVPKSVSKLIEDALNDTFPSPKCEAWAGWRDPVPVHRPGARPCPGSGQLPANDAGFGVPSTIAGVIPTPAMDRVAKAGLRYNRMFSTAMCSPTRAALITGRNHHSAGFGVISEQSTGFPGYNSLIERYKATIGRLLKDNGYSTAWFGKDHNVPAFQASQSGPFDQWPTGMDISAELRRLPLARLN
jgi:hypothetical protein